MFYRSELKLQVITKRNKVCDNGGCIFIRGSIIFINPLILMFCKLALLSQMFISVMKKTLSIEFLHIFLGYTRLFELLGFIYPYCLQVFRILNGIWPLIL